MLYSKQNGQLQFDFCFDPWHSLQSKCSFDSKIGHYMLLDSDLKLDYKIGPN